MESYVEDKNGVNVRDYKQVEFSFWLWYETDNASDYLALEYQNNQNEWIEVYRWFGIENGDWQQQTFSLSHFTQFQFRFLFHSDGNQQAKGVYIDDIIIAGIQSSDKQTGQTQFDPDLKKIDGVSFDYNILSQTATPKPVNQDVRTNYKELISSSTLQLASFPNPFNISTQVRYMLPDDCHVTLSVVNALGRLVTTLANEIQPYGVHEQIWNAQALSSGTYFIVLETIGIDNHARQRHVIKTLLYK
jgi:hypothetical protein